MHRDSLIDHIAAWLAEFSAAEQLVIMAAAFAAAWGLIMWVTL